MASALTWSVHCQAITNSFAWPGPLPGSPECLPAVEEGNWS